MLILAESVSPMRRHNITLSEPLSDKIRALVREGRFKSFSAALQEAAWKYFGEPDATCDEYGISAQEVERAYGRTLRDINNAWKSGLLKPYK